MQPGYLNPASKILWMREVPLERTSQDGSREVHLPETLFVARVRSLRYEVHRVGNGHHGKRDRTWTSLLAARTEAEMWANQLAFTSDSADEVLIRLTITEQSVSLTYPDYDRTTGLRYDQRPECGLLLKTLIVHQDSEATVDRVWSSRNSLADNFKLIDQYLSLYELPGRTPQECYSDVLRYFQRRQQK